MQDIMLWNAVLTLAVGAFLWWIRSINNDINKLREDLKDHALSDAKTREFMATNYATKKDVRFFDMIDESVWSNLSNIYTLMNSDSYTNMKTFAVDYKVSIGGDLEKRPPLKKSA